MDALYCIHWVWVYVLYVKCRCMYYMVWYDVWLYVCDAHYVSMNMVEEKALGVFKCSNRSRVRMEKIQREKLRIDERINIIILFQFYYACDL